MGRNLIIGFSGALLLLAFYAAVMTVLGGSWQAAAEQFKALWWLMVPLSAGFGTQLGMYSALRRRVKVANQKTLVAGGTSASAGMIACCAHHLADVLPFLGLSGVSIFLVSYQIPILLFSLAINIFGVVAMYRHLRMPG